MRHVAISSLLAVVVVTGAGAERSAATFHGSNGLIVYRATVGGHQQLFTIKPDGTAARQVTHFVDSDAAWPAWSPDGKRIAFERDFASRAAIYTMNADGSNLRSVAPRGLNGQPSWSPSGKQITFGRYLPGKEASIWIMNADGSHLKRVTRNPLPRDDGCGGCAGQGSSVFSPDGKRIAFTWVKGAGSMAVCIVGVDGKGFHRLTRFSSGVADAIDWSPDGSLIAFSSPEFGRPGKSSNVYVIRPDGTGLRRLTHESGGIVNDGLNSWSPDGAQIAFVSNRDGTYEIYTMDADGTSITQVTRGPEAHSARWGTAR